VPVDRKIRKLAEMSRKVPQKNRSLIKNKQNYVTEVKPKNTYLVCAYKDSVAVDLFVIELGFARRAGGSLRLLAHNIHVRGESRSSAAGMRHFPALMVQMFIEKLKFHVFSNKNFLLFYRCTFRGNMGK
jgi:hypothetical protein